LLIALASADAGLPRARAEDGSNVITLHCEAHNGKGGQQVNPPLFFFGDQPLIFDAIVTAPLGSRVSLVADVLQTTSGSLSARLLKNVAVSRDLKFDTRTQWVADCSLPALPPVRSRTHLLLRLYISKGGQPGVRSSAGSIDLYDYPRPSATAWRTTFAGILAQSGLAGAAVFGNGSGLRRFLKAQGIDYDDLGVDWPDSLDRKTLYLADSPPPRGDGMALLTGAHVVHFIADTASDLVIPGVYSISDPAGGATVKVNMPALLDSLEESPRSQEIFLGILRQTLNPQAAADDSTLTLPTDP